MWGYRSVALIIERVANEFMICIGHTSKTLVDCAIAYDMDIDFSLKLPHKAKEFNAFIANHCQCHCWFGLSLLFRVTFDFLIVLYKWPIHICSMASSQNTHYNVMCVWNQCCDTIFKLNERCGHTHIHKRNDFINWRFNDSNYLELINTITWWHRNTERL